MDFTSALFRELQAANLTIATAESCTGGLLASKLVDIPGISAYFKEGYITYSKEAKQRLLNVPEEIITTYGIVSTETALAMAKGAANLSGSDCAIATTGVAGPDGGSEDIPVGCVCLGCVVKGHTFQKKLELTGERNKIRKQAADQAIRFLLECIHEVNG